MTGWIQSQSGATVYEILKHLKTNRPTVCIFCKKDQKNMIAFKHHTNSCWMIHGTKWKEATK